MENKTGKTLKVAVLGAAGKMGREVCRAVVNAKDTELIAVVDPHPYFQDRPLSSLGINSDLTFSENLFGKEPELRPDVLVDFTHPDVVMDNMLNALRENIHCVVGTTGITPEDVEKLRNAQAKSQANILIASNFSIGAVLMMHFSSLAAKYLEHCEIIELHHPGKADAPSGTSISTAEKIGAVINDPLKRVDTRDSRGQDFYGVPIHSVRLPGLLAHQEVIFGSEGQLLTLRHDTTDRVSFMPGVLLGVRRVPELPGITIGLDNILEL